MGNDSPCRIKGIGSIRIKKFDGIIRTLSDVRYIPDMKRNLISLSTLDVKGFKYQGGDKLIKVSRGSLIVMKGDLNTSNCLYFLRGTTLSGNANVASSKVSDSDATNLWHLRLGHMSETRMLELCKRGLLDGQRIDKLEFCEHCVYGKQTRVKFGTATHNTKDILEYIHSDLWGESRVPSLGGARYMLTIIDDYSRRVWSFYIKHKLDVFNIQRVEDYD
jgi:hypothetical protein